MQARIRLALAAVIVAVSALGGAAYAQRAADDGTRQVATIDLSNLLSPQAGDGRLVDLAYERVERSYYKPVADQLLIDGERNALVTFLKQKKVAAPQIPAETVTGDRTHDLAAIKDALNRTSSRYARVASKDVFTQVAVGGMLGGLGDPYTTYLSADEMRSLDEQLKGGNFGGIGVYIVQDPKTKAILVDPIEGNPAVRAGMRPGDIILAVDKKPTAGKKLDDVMRELRGQKGTVVSVQVKHHGVPAPATLSVTRDDVHVPSVVAKIENGIDYVRLADFGATSADEVRKAFLDGKDKHVKGYILDLRNNGGGYLDAAVDVSSLFIPQGTIVSTIDRDGNKEERAANGRAIGTTPLVVLVNKYTASSSEITAGALQDYKVATILGTRTFGKGVVQSVYNTPDNGALKITTARYVTPLGRDIHHKGIIPDVVLDQDTMRPIIDTPNDRQLAAAKAIINKKDSTQ